MHLIEVTQEAFYNYVAPRNLHVVCSEENFLIRPFSEIK